MKDFEYYRNQLDYPVLPKKPVLSKQHTSGDVLKYMNDLQIYEDEI